MQPDMARSKVVPLQRRTPAYSPGRLTESHMEAAEAARRLLAFAEDELRRSFTAGDLGRLRALQRVHRDATTILAEHRRQAGWADAACAGQEREPGHGAAA